MQIATNLTENDIVDEYWENLRSLSIKAKLRLASLLTTAAFEEESCKENVTPPKRLVRVKRRAVDTPSDAQLESQFAEFEAPEIPEDPIWSAVIKANTGKTIKPIEKWL